MFVTSSCIHSFDITSCVRNSKLLCFKANLMHESAINDAICSYLMQESEYDRSN